MWIKLWLTTYRVLALRMSVTHIFPKIVKMARRRNVDYTLPTMDVYKHQKISTLPLSSMLGITSGEKPIILYPQAASNVFNPEACWDWWGYTGPDYSCRIGSQFSVIGKMVDDFTTGQGTNKL